MSFDGFSIPDDQQQSSTELQDDQAILIKNQWSDSKIQQHNIHIEAIVEKNQSLLANAEQHLKQARSIRETVFGDDDEYDNFIRHVENKLSSDADFQQKYQQLSETHDKPIEQEQSYSRVSQAHPHPIRTFIPGQPIERPVEAVINKKNHILRKDMV